DGRGERNTLAVFVLAQPARGRRTRHNDQLRAFERRDGRRERVPGILANEDGGLPTPTRVERAHAILSPIDEPLFIEHAVRRQKDLTMDVTDLGLLVAERRVQRRVVDVILKPLVEA